MLQLQRRDDAVLKLTQYAFMQGAETPVSRDAVLTWLEGTSSATLQEIADGVQAKQHVKALSGVLQELQNDFEIATKAGKYFTL